MATIAKLFETMEYGPAPESDAPALEWLKQHDTARFGHFINGRWVAPSEGRYFETINPTTKAVLARVAQGSKADMDSAVAAANAAAPVWSGLAPHARARRLTRASSRAAPVAPLAAAPTRQPVSPKRSPSRVTTTAPG